MFEISLDRIAVNLGRQANTAGKATVAALNAMVVRLFVGVLGLTDFAADRQYIVLERNVDIFGLDTGQSNLNNKSVPAGTYTITGWMPAESIDGMTFTQQNAQTKLAARPITITLQP